MAIDRHAKQPTCHGFAPYFQRLGGPRTAMRADSGPARTVSACEAVIADLNGDGVPEIIFTTYSSGQPRDPDTPAHLIILDNAGNELHKIEIFGRGSMAAPTLDDLDGDGDLELIISLKDTLGASNGGVQIWDVPGSADNCLQWATGRGNYLRTGWYPY